MKIPVSVHSQVRAVVAQLLPALAVGAPLAGRGLSPNTVRLSEGAGQAGVSLPARKARQAWGVAERSIFQL